MTRVSLRPTRKSERGMTLVEILVAFFILVVVTLAVLAMYSLALAVNLGSLARTDLAYRCERVIETVRFENALNALNATAHNGGCVPLADGTYTLSLSMSGCTPSGYWGSSGVNVIEEDPRYTISYTINNGVLTVEGRANLSGSRYVGSAISTKVVRYVVQL